MSRVRTNATRQAEPPRARPKRAASASAKQATKVHVLTAVKRTSKQKKSEVAQPAEPASTRAATSDKKLADCAVCHIQVGRGDLPRHLDVHRNFGQWFLCFFCDHSTRELHNLVSHAITHTKHNPLVCAYELDGGGHCTASFRKPQERCDHRRLVHRRLPPFFDYRQNKSGRRCLVGTSDPEIVDVACRDFELGCPPHLLQNAPAEKYQLLFSPIGMPYRVLVQKDGVDLPEPILRAVGRRKATKGRMPKKQKEGKAEEVESVEDEDEDEDGMTETEEESEDDVEAEVGLEIELESEGEGEGEDDHLPAYKGGAPNPVLPSQHPSLVFPTPPLTPPFATTPPRHPDHLQDAALSLLDLRNPCPPRPELSMPLVPRLSYPVIDHPRRFGAHRYQPYVAGYASRYQSRQTSSGLTGAFHPRNICKPLFYPGLYSR